jgi:zinc protease
LSSCWTTPRPAPPRRDVPITLAVEQFELANGLRVVVIPEPSLDEISVTMRLGAGAADDPVGKPGLAHLAEHVSFEHVRDGHALFEELEANALSFNGATSLTSTVFIEHAAPSQLAALLDLEAARLSLPCAQIPDTALVREREIVRNELRERAEDDRIRTALLGAVYGGGHRFATALATPDIAASITRDDVCGFIAAHYTPSDAVLVVSGHVSGSEVRPLITHTLGALARSARRVAVAVAPVSHGHAEIDAPVDRSWIVLTWPLPDQPAERARLRAVVAMVSALAEVRVNGAITRLELGDAPARQIAIALAPSHDISASDAIAGMRHVVSSIGDWYRSGVYEYAKNRAIYRFAAELDHSAARDAAIAEDVAAGRDVRASLDEALGALRSLERSDARNLALSALDLDRAKIVTVRPSRTSVGRSTTLTPSFREERRRIPEDPGAAHHPIAGHDDDTMLGVRQRTLDNGMHVVLVPLSTMATVDIRLMLPVGTGDEVGGQRGIAMLAAEALVATSDADHLRFFQAGGEVERSVDLDHTELAVRGLSANLDVLLAGLAQTVRDGTYDVHSIREATSWLQLRTATPRDDRLIIDAWLDAMFGSHHPYKVAGMWRGADPQIADPTALGGFRALHYVPDGATLVVAGRFDPNEAERWIDYYFRYWTGTRPRRSAPAAQLRPLGFAQVRDTDALAVRIAFPAARDRAASLVIAEMLDEAVANVRQELAASYGVHARFVEHRLASSIEIDGYIDSKRASDAFTLMREQLAQLRAGGDPAAALFVSARRRVVARLTSLDTRADALADLFTHDIAIEADTPSRALAERAGALTIDRIAATLSGLDLGNAAIVLRGPEAALAAAYAAIGRKPAMLE